MNKEKINKENENLNINTININLVSSKIYDNFYDNNDFRINNLKGKNNINIDISIITTESKFIMTVKKILNLLPKSIFDKEIMINITTANNKNALSYLSCLYIVLSFFTAENKQVKYNIISKYLDNNPEYKKTIRESYIFRNLIIKEFVTLINSNAYEINSKTLAKKYDEILEKYIRNPTNPIIKDFNNNNNNVYSQTIVNPSPLINAVGRGGEEKPVLYIAAFGAKNETDSKNIIYNNVFSGKGVTYDSGGYNIKPLLGMENMSKDKFGSLLSFFSALLKYKLTGEPILCITPIVTNMIDSKAFVSGDIYKTNLGENVYITNTDAEGRLILADTMEYLVSNYKFKNCYTIATLTYAIILSIGFGRSGYMTTSEELAKKIEFSSKESNELIHRLPFDEHYSGDLITTRKGKKVVNNLVFKHGTVPAGSIMAGSFIKHFFDNAVKLKNQDDFKPLFAHFDICGLISDNYLNNLSYSYNLLMFSTL